MTLPSFVLLTLTIKNTFTGLSTHPTENSLHAGLAMTLMSESGTHGLANSLANFKRLGWMQWPSHLF